MIYVLAMFLTHITPVSTEAPVWKSFLKMLSNVDATMNRGPNKKLAFFLDINSQSALKVFGWKFVADRESTSIKAI